MSTRTTNHEGFIVTFTIDDVNEEVDRVDGNNTSDKTFRLTLYELDGITEKWVFDFDPGYNGGRNLNPSQRASLLTFNGLDGLPRLSFPYKLVSL